MCDEYCCNYGCNQGRDCPARKAVYKDKTDSKLGVVLWALALVAAGFGAICWRTI